MWSDSSKKLYGCISSLSQCLTRLRLVEYSGSEKTGGEDDLEERRCEPGDDVRRAEMLARTLLTGLRDGDDEEEEAVVKLDGEEALGLPRLLAIDSSEEW